MAKMFVREILEAVTLAGQKVRLSAQQRFAAEVRKLNWSDSQIAGMVARLVAARSRLMRIALPDICDDASAWAGSHFSVLAPNTIGLTAELSSTRFTFATAEGPGTLEAAIFERLERYETPNQRNRAKQLMRLPSRFGAGQPSSAWVTIIDKLGIYQS